MDYDINAYSSEEDVRRPKTIRHRPNYFQEYDEVDFLARFRLSKRSVRNIIQQIEGVIAHPTDRNDCLSACQQVLLTLNFYANGSFLRCTGDFAGVSKSTASLVVRRVSLASAGLKSEYINMPSTDDDIANLRQEFYNIARFPRCIGAIDCTDIKIQSPGGDNAELFRIRKQFFSINVQTVADPSLKIRNIVARWPGSSHDSHIFRNSTLCGYFERGDYPQSVLVGDSGYGIKTYLLTPLLNPRTPAESLYNESQIRTRNVVGETIRSMETSFPITGYGVTCFS